MTYKMPDDIRSIAYNSDMNEFDLNEFFKAKVEDGHPVTDAKFIHEEGIPVDQCACLA